MKVAFDLTPLSGMSAVRGVGFYTQRLLNAIKTGNFKDLEMVDPEMADLIHIPYFSPFFITLPFNKKKPTVVTVHDLIPLKYPEHFPPGIKGKLKWQIQKNLLKQVDMIITDSEASAKDIVNITGILKTKVRVVYLAADAEFKPSSKKINKYKLPEKFVLYVGDINWNKNIPGLVKACEKIKIPLVIVGKQAVSKDYDITHPENQDLVWLQNNDKNIRRLGFVPTEDLNTIYSMASVYAQVSFDEGFGLPVLEAMACGCPVVIADRGSLPEIAGEAALKVDPYNINSIAEGLEKVIMNKKLAQELSKKGLLQAKKFSWEKAAEETVEVYKEILRK